MDNILYEDNDILQRMIHGSSIRRWYVDEWKCNRAKWKKDRDGDLKDWNLLGCYSKRPMLRLPNFYISAAERMK